MACNQVTGNHYLEDMCNELFIEKMYTILYITDYIKFHPSFLKIAPSIQEEGEIPPLPIFSVSRIHTAYLNRL